VSEVCGADVADLGHDSGHRTVRLRMKGGKTRTRAVPPPVAAAIDAHLAGRGEGPLFTTADGRRLDRHGVARFVRRAAVTAGLAAADKITPHSFRHAWATLARERGATLEERQYALGHADPRTTQRYDRARELFDPRYDHVRPRAIVYCATARDVATTVAFARDADLPLALRSGGHSYAGWSTGTGVVLDVSRISAVRVAGDTAEVGAGAQLIDVYAGVAAQGQALPAGSCPSTQVLDPWGSRSTRTTRLPASASAALKLTAEVVLPTPPF